MVFSPKIKTNACPPIKKKTLNCKSDISGLIFLKADSF